MYDTTLEILYFLFHNLEKKTRKPLSLTSQNNMITATELYHPSLTPLPPLPPKIICFNTQFKYIGVLFS